MKIDWKLRAAQGLVTVTFIGSNIGLNFYNPWLLARHPHQYYDPNKHHNITKLEPSSEGPSFSFPIFYTMWHMLASVLGTCVIMTFQPPATGFPNPKQMWHYKWKLLPLSLTTAIYIGTNNWSLMLVSLFINQVVKSCAPLPTMLFSGIIEHKRYSWGAMISCLLICAGAILAIPLKKGGPAGTSVEGMVLVITSVCFQGLKPVIQAMVMAGSETHPKLPPTVAVFYDCFFAFWIFLVWWLAHPTERPESIEYFSTNAGRAFEYVFVGSFMAFSFNLSNYYFIKLTGSLTIMIVANGIKVMIMVISALQFGQLYARNWCGVGTTCLALCAYAYCSFKKFPPAKLPFVGSARQQQGGDVESGDSKKTPILTGTVVSESTPLRK